MSKQISVKLHSDRGKLRLRWSIDGTRYNLSTGFDDDEMGRRMSRHLGNQIELDIFSGEFDPTLRRYKREDRRPDSIAISKLFDRFMDSRQKEIYANSLVRYSSTCSRLIEFFGDVSVSAIDRNKAKSFRDWLTERVSAVTVRDRIVSCSTCWDWAIEQKVAFENPWNLSIRVPVRRKEPVFSPEETQAILDIFGSDRYLTPYEDFVHFLFYTGCRIGEAIGLRWESVNLPKVWIGESMSRGLHKESKNNKERTISLPPSLSDRLAARPREDKMVFLAPRGGCLHDKNFNNRPWKRSLKLTGIPYRRPYMIRATAITRMLMTGMHYLEVASIAGHDPATMYQHYVVPMEQGNIPELSSD